MPLPSPLVQGKQVLLKFCPGSSFCQLHTMAEDLCPPHSIFAVFANPHPSAAVLNLSNTAALKTLSTHVLPFRRLRRCFWFVLHRSTVTAFGDRASLA